MACGESAFGAWTNQANARPGRDFIDFNVGGGGVQTIALISGLPRITDPVEIDATTQPGFAGAPIIELSGQIASGAVGLHVSASDTTVRGLVINRFHFGIQVSRLAPRPAPSGVRIGGNFIGTDVTGLLPRGNAFGVFWNAPVGTGNRIGGTSPTARNVISANRFDGVQVVGTGLTIQGNLIGIGADGATPLGNGNNGVFVFTTFDVGGNSTIGGLEPGAGNVIAFNQWHGVWAHTPAAVLSNSIHSNGLLGINQFSGGEAGGLDLNDVELCLSVRTAHTDDGAPGDPQNYPVLTSAVSAGGQTTISGHLGSRANETFLLQFFGNTTVEPSGFGQGRTLLGSASVTTGADGRAEFTVTLPVALPHRHLLTATATGARNETSEFSRRLAVGDVLTSVYTVNTTDDVDDGTTLDRRHPRATPSPASRHEPKVSGHCSTGRADGRPQDRAGRAARWPGTTAGSFPILN